MAINRRPVSHPQIVLQQIRQTKEVAERNNVSIGWDSGTLGIEWKGTRLLAGGGRTQYTPKNRKTLTLDAQPEKNAVQLTV
jgi:hypothetical protein